MNTELAVTIAGHDISWDDLRHLLCCALEGGSNYWYTIAKFIPPENPETPWGDEDMVFRHLDYPCKPGGALRIEALEDDHPKEAFKVVNRETLIAGLHTMAEKYPQHFDNFVREQYDAETGDVFLQCVTLGEIVYG